jgi:hypothetical protein
VSPFHTHRVLFWCLGDASKLLFPSVDQVFSAGTGATHFNCGDVQLAAWRLRSVVNPSIISYYMHLPKIAFTFIFSFKFWLCLDLLLEFVLPYCGYFLAFLYFVLFVLVDILSYIDAIRVNFCCSWSRQLTPSISLVFKITLFILPLSELYMLLFNPLLQA